MKANSAIKQFLINLNKKLISTNNTICLINIIIYKYIKIDIDICNIIFYLIKSLNIIESLNIIL